MHTKYIFCNIKGDKHKGQEVRRTKVRTEMLWATGLTQKTTLTREYTLLIE
jgi:hypothetical protein